MKLLEMEKYLEKEWYYLKFKLFYNFVIDIEDCKL